MSKGGGAGKVYFVLYLAVVLELLIIIVERDEAEEHLHKKQKETMKIVESILSQLQSGSGTDGINTRPQDEITMVASDLNAKEAIGIDIKTDRQYLVEVGVTDISDEITRRKEENEIEYGKRVKKLIELGNVEELEYQVFYSNHPDLYNAPPFPTDKELKKMNINVSEMQPGQTIPASDGSVWTFKGIQKLTLDKEKMFEKIDFTNVTLESTTPIYQKSLQVGPTYHPAGKLPADSAFYYSIEKTDISRGLKKRTFMVNFEPERQAGWFKLRFASRTNKILGVRKDQKVDELNTESKVNIGTVQLTVGDLMKVKKELTSTLEKYVIPSETVLTVDNDIDKFDDMLDQAQKMAFKEENAAEVASKIQLYGYIVKLLAPGQSVHFPQNQGSIEFNIHVQLPDPPISDPVIVMPASGVRCFDKIEAVFPFTISPYKGEGQNRLTGAVKDINGRVVANIICSPLTATASGTPIPPPTLNGERLYLGTIDHPLPRGRYVVAVTHSVNSKTISKESELVVFESKLTEESETYIKRKFERAYYGKPHLKNQSVVPVSDGINPEQFRIYLRTDDQNQIAPIEGTAIPDDRALVLPMSANKVFLRVSWKQPFTGKEVDLLVPELEATIKLEPPSISLVNAISTQNQVGNKVKISITNITTSLPSYGEGLKAKVILKADKPSIDGIDNNNYSIELGQPREVKPGTFELDMEVTFKFPSDKSRLSGIVTIPLTAVASANDKTNSAVANYQFEIKADKQGRSTGGSTPGSGSKPSTKSQPSKPSGSGQGRPR